MNIASIACLIIFLLCSSSHAADKLRFGFPDLAAQFIPLPLAEQRGFFKEEGLQGNLFGSGPRYRPRRWSVRDRLRRGDRQWHRRRDPGTAGEGRRLFLPATPIALIVRPEFQNRSKSSRARPSTQHFRRHLESIARLIVKHFGLDPDKDVKFLATGTADSRFAAMKQGLTAATLVLPRWIFSATSWVFVVLARANELFSFPASGLVATVKKHQRTAR